MSTSPVDPLSLVDYRTRVTDLYAQVRAETDPATGHARWRSGRDELFRTHPQSPLAARPADDELRAGGLPCWPYDPNLRFEVEVHPERGDPEVRVVDTGADGELRMRRLGHVELPDPVAASLDVWWLHQYGGGLFVPLRDATAGTTSYGGGRYLLDTAKGSWLGGRSTGTATTLVLDLNFAYHPSCRYDPAWQCPLAPEGNTVSVAVEAGERLEHGGG